MDVHTGKCLCGDVNLQVAGEPVVQGNCHCTDCKKNTGAAYATILFLRTNRSKLWAVKQVVFNIMLTVETKKLRCFVADVVRWYMELIQADPESDQYTLESLMMVVLPNRSSMFSVQEPCLL